MDGTALQRCQTCAERNFEVDETKRRLQNKEEQLKAIKGRMQDIDEKTNKFMQDTAEILRKQFEVKDKEIYNLKDKINTLHKLLREACPCEQNVRLIYLHNENEDLKAKINVLELKLYQHRHLSTEEQFKPLAKIDLLENRLIALENKLKKVQK